MYKIILLLLLPFFTILFSQTFNMTGTVYDPPLPYTGSGDWGTDLLVSNTEPFGRCSGVYRLTDNALFVAVSDTNILAGNSLVILRSTNNGSNWSIVYSVGPASVQVVKTKMLKTANDSVYCGILANNSFFFILNVTSSSLRLLNSNYRDFDMHSTPSSSIYCWMDTAGSNSLYRWGTTNGGVTYATRGNVTSSAAHPRVYCPAGSDTCILNYYTALVADTMSSGILSVRYRESAPGTAASVGSFTTVIPAGTRRDQFAGVKYRNNAWIFYTTGVTGSIDMNCITSVDGGATWGSQVVIGSQPSRDEYWFDAAHYTLGSGGVDLIYYSDSLQGGAPTNSSDKMFYTGASTSAPGTFAAGTQFSEHPPGWNARGYIPFIIEYYNPAGDMGAVWVGQDGANKRLYFDRLQATVGIKENGGVIPSVYSLSQNYPNPFNPATKIEFAIPQNEFVTMKVFDILGRETAVLISKDLTAGSYTVDFDASKLASGVYFYTITAGNYYDIKRMVLVK
jgi:hypothetical protein